MTQIRDSEGVDPYSNWEDWRKQEFRNGLHNGRVGGMLVSETDEVRIWHISLAPGDRLGFHCHVLNYFWTSLANGRARSNYGDGSVREVEYSAGTTAHYAFAEGEAMVHDLENVGDTPLLFVTVEFKKSGNHPLPI